MKHINRKNIIIAVTAIVLLSVIVSGITIFNLRKTTPYEYLQNHFNESESAVYPSQLLYQTNDESNENIIIVFYANKNGGFNCAILEKTMLSFKLLDSSGSLFFGDDKTQYKYGYYTGSYLGSWYDYDGQRKALFWGINKDESVEKLLVDGKESECAEINDDNGINFKLFWIIGDWEDSPDFREIQAQATE
ncbi:MAG: hypothetical protein PUB37_03955 [Firmicutes bacterium]|nr:hypothetical protein [Bacillota bacterium]